MATGGEWPAGLALLRGLRRGDYEPVAALSRRNAIAHWSRAPIARVPVADPLRDGEAHMRDVARAAESLGAAAVLPGTEASMLAMAEHGGRFPTAAVVAVPELEVVRRATDKMAVAALAESVGLDTPPTHVGTDAQGFEGPFPAIVKPLTSVVSVAGGRRQRVGVRYVRDPAELDGALAQMRPTGALVQPFIDGHLRTVNGVAWKGEVVCFVHKRGERTWPPAAGVVVYGQTVAPDRRLEDGCSRLLEQLEWSGIFNLQFLETPRGDRLLIDLNPRAYHSMALAIGAGANLPRVWCDLVLGRTPGAVHARAGVRFRSEIEDVRAAHATARQGDVGSALAGLVPRRNTVHALFEPRDPGPLVRALLRPRQ